ncbi:unnamed protein product [Closterium sp. NIES-64]|nr:unnamed protein product [Closterium sp. NIES-64]
MDSRLASSYGLTMRAREEVEIERGGKGESGEKEREVEREGWKRRERRKGEGGGKRGVEKERAEKRRGRWKERGRVKSPQTEMKEERRRGGEEEGWRGGEEERWVERRRGERWRRRRRRRGGEVVAIDALMHLVAQRLIRSNLIPFSLLTPLKNPLLPPHSSTPSGGGNRCAHALRGTEALWARERGLDDSEKERKVWRPSNARLASPKSRALDGSEERKGRPDASMASSGVGHEECDLNGGRNVRGGGERGRCEWGGVALALLPPCLQDLRALALLSAMPAGPAVVLGGRLIVPCSPMHAPSNVFSSAPSPLPPLSPIPPLSPSGALSSSAMPAGAAEARASS